MSKIDELTSQSNMGTMIAPGVAWGNRLLSPSEPFTEGAAYSKSVRMIMVVITDGELTTEGEWNVQGDCSAATNSVTPYEFDPAKLGLKGSVLKTHGTIDTFSPYGSMYDSAPTGGGGSWTAVADGLEKLSLDACQQFKKNNTGDGNVQLYTIAASSGAGPGTRVHSLLQQCATDTDHFFYAESEADLDTAFTSIAKMASELHLTQ